MPSNAPMYFRTPWAPQRCFAMLVLVPLSVLVGCATTHLPIPTLEVARGSASSLPELQAGRATYIAKCSSCHLAVLPGDFTAAQWPALVDDMAERSRLEGTQREEILRYLRAYAKPAPR